MKGRDTEIAICEVCLHSPHLRGCPLAPAKVIAYCVECGTRIYNDEEIWSDAEDNFFCSEYCAEKYHKIQKITEELNVSSKKKHF